MLTHRMMRKSWWKSRASRSIHLWVGKSARRPRMTRFCTNSSTKVAQMKTKYQYKFQTILTQTHPTPSKCPSTNLSKVVLTPTDPRPTTTCFSNKRSKLLQNRTHLLRTTTSFSSKGPPASFLMSQSSKKRSKMSWYRNLRPTPPTCQITIWPNTNRKNSNVGPPISNETNLCPIWNDCKNSRKQISNTKTIKRNIINGKIRNTLSIS